MIRLKNVLVATDFSETSGSALAYGRELARTFGAKLHVLHVTDNIMRYSLEGGAILPPELQREVEDAARARLEKLLGEDDRKELGAVAVLRTSLTPADCIVEYAAEAGIDTIVVGTHGRRALAHVLLGSVAERVVRMAPCPVLTVRHPEREFLVRDALVARRRETSPPVPWV
jgi:nucleotide-binding universal stress UspA family protein